MADIHTCRIVRHTVGANVKYKSSLRSAIPDELPPLLLSASLHMNHSPSVVERDKTQCLYVLILVKGIQIAYTYSKATTYHLYLPICLNKGLCYARHDP